MCTTAKKYVNLLLLQMIQDKQFEVTMLSNSCMMDFLSLNSRKEFRKSREKITYEDVLSGLKSMVDRAASQNVKTKGKFMLQAGDSSFEAHLTIGSSANGLPVFFL